jgi:DNA polymerase sigma
MCETVFKPQKEDGKSLSPKKVSSQVS